MTTSENSLAVIDILLEQWDPVTELMQAIPGYEQRLQLLQRGSYDPNDRRWRHRVDRIDAFNHLGALVLVHGPIPRKELEDKSGLRRAMFASLIGGLTSQELVEALHPHDVRSRGNRYAYIPTKALRWGLAQPARYPELASHHARLAEAVAPKNNA